MVIDSAGIVTDYNWLCLLNTITKRKIPLSYLTNILTKQSLNGTSLVLFGIKLLSSFAKDAANCLSSSNWNKDKTMRVSKTQEKVRVR